MEDNQQSFPEPHQGAIFSLCTPKIQEMFMVEGAFEVLQLIPQNEGAGTNKILKEGLSTVTDIAGREARTRSQISRQMAKYSLHSSGLGKEIAQHGGEFRHELSF